jgi:hypothetical protein
MLNHKLSKPVSPDDRDALWATAALLGVIAFSSIEASTPKEAWPLSSNLDWLRMSEGKAVIWNITNPMRPDSVFYPLADEYRRGYFFSAAPPLSGTEGIPTQFVALYDLDVSSTTDNNPYYTTVHVLALLLSIECNQSTIAKFLGFIGHMKPDYRKLLELKDPRALLLLAYWYAKVCRSLWWLERRAMLECQAICLYLERYHAEETAILELLQFPKVRCGLEP